MGDVGHKMLGKELKSRENHQKRLKSIGKTMRQLFVYCDTEFEDLVLILKRNK